MIDMKTVNKSFIEISDTLKINKVYNYDFMLQLFDKRLVGVDPYDNNLNRRDKRRVVKEIKSNPWYFFREVVRFSDIGDLIPFNVDLLSLTSIFLQLNSINYIVVNSTEKEEFVPRVLVDLWISKFFNKDYFCRYIDYTTDNARKRKLMIDKIFSNLPEYIKTNSFDKRDTNISYMETILDEERINHPGKGISAHSVFLGNIERMRFSKDVYEIIYPSVSAGIEDAKKNNIYHGIGISIKVPKKIDDENKWIFEMINKYSEEINFKIFDTVESKEIYVFVNYSWKEIGKKDEWYSHMKKIYGDSEYMRREIDTKETINGILEEIENEGLENEK
jgi:hypothetical protein